MLDLYSFLPSTSHDGLVWLDTATTRESGRSLLAVEPERILRGNIFHDAADLRDAIAQGQQRGDSNSGGLFGWVGFGGDYTFGVYREHRVFTASSGKTIARSDLGSGIQFFPQTTKESYCAIARRAQEYIAAGDIYQVNLSYPWMGTWPTALDPLSFYARLRDASPAPFAAFLDLDGTQVFSTSPECFLRITARHILTRPIKGTRPRGATTQADQLLAEELTSSAKERAELVMITDLERNDLGQVCEFGSVRATGLLELERFAQVQHLVSTVEGRLLPEVDHVTAFLACFPGGSISGAPKKRALEIIQELESHHRGLYTGAIGWFGFHGETQFSIAIRTAWRRGHSVQFHTGAGIVADSVPELEWEETQHKAAGILAAAMPTAPPTEPCALG